MLKEPFNVRVECVYYIPTLMGALDSIRQVVRKHGIREVIDKV